MSGSLLRVQPCASCRRISDRLQRQRRRSHEAIWSESLPAGAAPISNPADERPEGRRLEIRRDADACLAVCASRRWRPD